MHYRLRFENLKLSVNNVSYLMHETEQNKTHNNFNISFPHYSFLHIQ